MSDRTTERIKAIQWMYYKRQGNRYRTRVEPRYISDEWVITIPNLYIVEGEYILSAKCWSGATMVKAVSAAWKDLVTNLLQVGVGVESRQFKWDGTHFKRYTPETG